MLSHEFHTADKQRYLSKTSPQLPFPVPPTVGFGLVHEGEHPAGVTNTQVYII